MMTMTTHRPPDQHRGRRRAVELTAVAATAAAGWLLPSLLQGTDAPAPALPPTPVAVAPVPVEWIGQVLATSADSITARDADGHIFTVRITPETAQVPESAAGFLVNDVIVVQATERDGSHVATAVADRDMVGPDGPPMDYGL
jgi:hypothetical protein